MPGGVERRKRLRSLPTRKLIVRGPDGSATTPSVVVIRHP